MLGFALVCMTHTVAKVEQQQNLGRIFGASKMHLSSPRCGLGCGSIVLGCGSVVVNQLFNVLPIVCGLCFAMYYFLSILVLQPSGRGRQS